MKREKAFSVNMALTCPEYFSNMNFHYEYKIKQNCFMCSEVGMDIKLFLK